MSQLVLFTDPEEHIELPVIFEDDSPWLSQQELADLFQKSVSNVSEHITNIYSEKELDKDSTFRNFRNIGNDGKTRDIGRYNVDMVIAIGYRVKNSRIGTKFRQWATKQLKELMTKGFVIDDERLLNGHSRNLDELVERVRAIRTSEKHYYEKVKSIFATSSDYTPNSPETGKFFAKMQNKFEFAISGKTAPELIVSRANSEVQNMGLTCLKGANPTKAEAEVGKNYLYESELYMLRLLSEQFLSFAELRATAGLKTTMQWWDKKFDEFLRFNERPVSNGKGTVSRETAKKHAHREYEAYKQKIAKLDAIPDSYNQQALSCEYAE